MSLPPEGIRTGLGNGAANGSDGPTAYELGWEMGRASIPDA
ncbi:MAG TPA: hypothetical protein PLZ92_07190 [Phycicoccus sp.]|nr:hypothetical protein [Phycicoccus sp.]